MIGLKDVFKSNMRSLKQTGMVLLCITLVIAAVSCILGYQNKKARDAAPLYRFFDNGIYNGLNDDVLAKSVATPGDITQYLSEETLYEESSDDMRSHPLTRYLYLAKVEYLKYTDKNCLYFVNKYSNDSGDMGYVGYAFDTSQNKLNIAYYRLQYNTKSQLVAPPSPPSIEEVRSLEEWKHLSEQSKLYVLSVKEMFNRAFDLKLPLICFETKDAYSAKNSCSYNIVLSDGILRIEADPAKVVTYWEFIRFDEWEKGTDDFSKPLLFDILRELGEA